MKNIREVWQTPPLGKTYVGFWSFNHLEVQGRSSEAEIRWQLDQMHAKGIRDVVLFRFYSHQLPYLAERWREVVEAMLAYCRRKGMKVWLWDEDCWPPGNAGGKLTHEHPEYRARLLSYRMEADELKGGPRVQIPLSDQFPVAVFAVEKGGKRIVDLAPFVGPCDTEWQLMEPTTAYMAPLATEDFSTTTRALRQSPQYHLDWKPPAGTWKIVSYLLNEGHHYHGWVADTLNPDAVRAWLDMNHGWYWQHFREYFGSTIKGFYSAEPPHTRWTPKLWEYFRDLKGYDLKPLLPHLTMDLSAQSARIRMDYQEVHSELYARHFIRQVRQWCERHGVLYMGRLGYEERPAEMMESAGNLMTAIREFSVQASDLINDLQIGDREHPNLNVGANLSYSISRQSGTPSYMEIAPVGRGWKGNLGETRCLFDWSLIIGADQASHTIMPYSIDGYRKRECPPAFFYQSPEWECFDEFARRIERVGALVRAGKDVRRVALLYPISSLAAKKVHLSWESEAACEIDRGLIAVHQALLEAHVPFDVLDEAMLDLARTKAGSLRIGKARYEWVIVPPCTHLPSNRCAVLDEFARRGGQLIRFLTPVTQKVSPWKQGGRLQPWRPRRARTVRTTAALVRLPEMVRLQAAHLPPDVLCRRVEGPTFEALFVLNTASRKLPLGWPVEGDGWEKWCPDSGGQSHAADETLGSRELGVFVRARGRQRRPSFLLPAAQEAASRVPAVTIPLDAEWEFSGLQNCLYLDRWNMWVDTESRLKPEEVLRKHWLTLSNYRTEVGPLIKQVRLAQRPEAFNPLSMPGANVAWDGDVPEIPAKYLPVFAYYHNVFRLGRGISRELRLLMETDGLGGEWSLWLNGHEIRSDQFRFERVFDVGNRVLKCGRYLRYGKVNKLRICVKAGKPTDGLLQPIRILGDFRIDDQPIPVLTPTPAKIVAGSWTAQGYPHASGWGRYRQALKLDPGLLRQYPRWMLDCGEVHDGCRLRVNGELVGARLWKPFLFDVTVPIRRPSVEIVIEVANNAGNLIAGETKPSGLMGPVRLLAYR